jgi:hypothetical protein
MRPMCYFDGRLPESSWAHPFDVTGL